jgi:hypothetical protein
MTKRSNFWNLRFSVVFAGAVDDQMRLARPRLMVRWLMVAVAAMAVVFGVWRRREHFLERARYYADALSDPSIPPPPATEIDTFRARFEYYDRLRLKYEHAARFPFLPIEADPPPPE